MKGFDETVEHELCVYRTGACLGMELACEPGILLVGNTFVGAVVHVDEQFTPFASQCLGIHGITMVLACYIASVSAHLANRLVVGTVTIL